MSSCRRCRLDQRLRRRPAGRHGTRRLDGHRRRRRLSRPPRLHHGQDPGRPTRRRFTDKEQRQPRKARAPVSPLAACPHVQSIPTCRVSRSARRSPRIPWAAPWLSQAARRFLALTPTSRCWSAQRRPRLKCDSYSSYPLESPRPVSEILAWIRAAHRGPPTTLPPERRSPFTPRQRPTGSLRRKSVSRLIYLIERFVHGLRYTIWRVPRHVFAERSCIDIAP